MSGRQLPLSALRIPNPLTSGPPAAPQGPSAMPALPEPIPEEEQISPRVPVPKTDFPEERHKELHDSLGEEFDKPEAAAWLRHVYPVARRGSPHVDPRHVLEATRDAYYAVKHGFADPASAGRHVRFSARRRQRDEDLRRTVDVEPDTQRRP
jgi:hypothetical protein